MADEDARRNQTKRTVRRVVKRAPERPRVTLGRPDESTGTTRSTASSRQARSSHSVKQRSVTQRSVGNKKPKKQRTSARVRLQGLNAGASQLARRTQAMSQSAAVATQTTVGRVRALRLPTMPQPAAAALSGLIVGLVAVVIGWFCMHLFSWVRGTSTGGRPWGFIAIIAVVAIALIAGELLLSRLGVRRARLTSITGISLTLALILAFFLELIDGAWIWLIVPASATACFAVMHKALVLADEYQTE